MERERPELGPRKGAVLHAVVEQYVRSGEPVSSESIADHAGLGVSSATIRNEMAALEELGYLTHPHTSAGRIPTDAGYRHFVDSLPAGGRLREAQRRLIVGYFADAIVDLEEVLKGSVQLLSRLTQYAGLAVPPSAVEEPIVRVELIDMGPTLMILAVGQHGRVDKQVVDKPEGRRRPRPCSDADRRLQSLRGLTYLDAQARLLQLAAEGGAAERESAAVRGRDAAGRDPGGAGGPRRGRRRRRTSPTRPSRCAGRRSGDCSRRSSVSRRCSPCCRTSAPRTRA